MRKLLLPLVIFGVIGLPLIWNAKNNLPPGQFQNGSYQNGQNGYYNPNQPNQFAGPFGQNNPVANQGFLNAGFQQNDIGQTPNNFQAPIASRNFQTQTVPAVVTPSPSFPPSTSPVATISPAMIPPIESGTVIQGPQVLPPGARRTSVQTAIGPPVGHIPAEHSAIGNNQQLVPIRTASTQGQLSSSNIHLGPATIGSGLNPFSNNAAVTSGGGVVSQTVVFPGTASAPDLNAAPMQFLPTSSFAEIIRFDIQPDWVKQRWKRISTSPGESGLHGLRVPVVTGTNTTDLHGSLTYYFDANQRAQRVTFRGWTGNASRLTDLLQKQFGFKAQPTHWAGFYLMSDRRGDRGALLLQHPAVIRTDNPVQQVAIVMEINNPQGPFGLSQDLTSMIPAARKK